MLLVALAARESFAHPSIENSAEIVIHPDQVSVIAKVSLPQIDIEQSIDSLGVGAVEPDKLKAAIEGHAPYFAEHFDVSADGTMLTGRVISAAPPGDTVLWEDFDRHEATYTLSYPIERAPPKQIYIAHDLLDGFTRLGQGWAVNFTVRIRQAHDEQFTQELLTLDQPIDYTCTWPAATTKETITATTTATTAPLADAPSSDPRPTAAATSLNTPKLAWSYFMHGLHHILVGYDHLLFVAALVLAATRLWDLVKVVTAFAVAHTLTLTLSVLNLVRLDASIVEPVIAGSIVVVALQNAILPRQSQGKARLAIAFIFGLFHGLGFAGGLLEAMEGMPAINLIVALIAFTLGVEVAHQILIIPLYAILKLIRSRLRKPGAASTETPAPEAAPLPAGVPLFVRFASFMISLAGMVYLVAALMER